MFVKILNDFRETGMDPDDNETKNNRDKQPSVAIASEKLVIWMHNNPKSILNQCPSDYQEIIYRRGTESSESAEKKTCAQISSVDLPLLHLNFGIAASRARILENNQVSVSDFKRGSRRLGESWILPFYTPTN